MHSMYRYLPLAMIAMAFALPIYATPGNVAPPPPQGAVPPVVLAAGNLVANGDFETGAFAPQWTTVPGGGFDQVCKAGNPIGAAICITHGGLYAMSFGLGGATDTMSQTIATVPGTHYVVSFWVANDNPTGAGVTTFVASWNGTPIYSLPSPQASFGYRQISVDVVATANATPLAFTARHDPSQWFLDDVSVAAAVPAAGVPTLAQWNLLLLTLLLVGVGVRQSRRRG